MTDEFDRDLRAALQAEGDRAMPDPNAWDAVEPRLGKRPGRSPWQWVTLGVAAVAAAILVAIIVWPEDEGEVVSVDTTTAPTTSPQLVTVPSTTPTTPAATPAPTPAPTTAPTTAPPTTVAVPLPSQAVAVTVDGRLVVLDTSGGAAVEVRELASGPDPRVDDGQEGDASYLGAPSLTPDGETVYYHFCCEPVVGDLLGVLVDGSIEPDRLGYGSDPAVSPDGTRLAYVAYDSIVVRDLATVVDTTYPDPDHAGLMIDVTWTADGQALLYVRERELVRLDLASGQTQVIHTGQGWLAAPLDIGGTITVVDQCCFDDGTPTLEEASLVRVGGGATPLPSPVTDRQVSADGVELRAYQDGSLVWIGDGGESQLGSGYSYADW
jgi:hypothetical protein